MNPTDLLKFLKHYPASLRAEVMVQALFERGILDSEKTYIKPAGLFQRDTQSSEIVDLEAFTNDQGQVRQTDISVSREGLFDSLPPGLIHQQQNNYHQTAKEVGHARLRSLEEERDGRGFFFPIDQEFFRYRLLLEKHEHNLYEGMNSASVRKMLWQFWVGESSPDGDPVKEAYFLSILPAASRNQQNFSSLSVLLEGLLGVGVSLVKVEAREARLPEDQVRQLGTFRLGMDSILGETFLDGLPRLEIHVGPVPLSLVDDLLPGGSLSRWSDLFSSWFLPVGLERELKVNVSPKEDKFRLGENAGEGRLNFSTVLGL